MPRAWSREQSQRGEVGEWTKPGPPWERCPRCGANLKGGSLPRGRGYRSQVGSLGLLEGIHHVLWNPGISLTHPKDSKRSLSVAFPNLPLQPHSCGLSSCWQAPIPTQAMQDHPVLCSSNVEREETEESLGFGPRTGTPDCFLKFWGSVASITGVYKAMLAPGRALRGRRPRLALGLTKSLSGSNSLVVEGASGLI